MFVKTYMICRRPGKIVWVEEIFIKETLDRSRCFVSISNTHSPSYIITLADVTLYPTMLQYKARRPWNACDGQMDAEAVETTTLHNDMTLLVCASIDFLHICPTME